jgi:hypothetical protein
LSEGNQRGDFVPFNFSKNVSAPDSQAIKAGRADRQRKRKTTTHTKAKTGKR